MYNNFGTKNYSLELKKFAPYETAMLSLSSKKAKKFLGWKTKMSTSDTLKLTSNWYQKFYNNIGNPYDLCIEEIKLIQKD